ncbi:MAG TPA: peptidylprolyl isomerase [Thermoanaerobaculia bacterium]|jgi:parvulin-like peptidyl-prolyl isomerase|nr:peptidylprolyl isomerase [Thermoanaerobaculia bacterium]
MKRIMIAAIPLFVAVATLAQTPADDQQKIVAVINGETITKAKLDLLYNSMPAQMRSQYEKSGGKIAFLDNYVAKRLMLQEAIKSGFDKRPDVQATLDAARESALFDKYIKETVVPTIVTDQEVRKYYDEHKSEFVVPESAKVRHIVITWNNKPQPEALEQIKRVATEIRGGAPSPRDTTSDSAQVLLSRFSEAARKYSEDGVAQSGGDLGWVTKGSLDKNFEEAAFAMKPMMMSGIVESQFGYHLIFVEGKKPEGIQSFDEVKPDIREFLMAQHGADIMGSVKRLTNELRANSKVAFYPENVK